MKTHIKLLTGAALALAAATPHASAQTATTDPVGYITIDIPGGTLANGKYSVISPTLLNPVEYQGKVSTAPVGAALVLEGAAFAANAYNPTTVLVPANTSSPTAYVEVVSVVGTSAADLARVGAWANVLTTQAGGVTTTTALGLAVGDTVRIRKHITVTQLFGADGKKANIKGAATFATADNITLLGHSATGAPTASGVYLYNDGDPNSVGWVTPSVEDAANLAIEPQQGILIKRIDVASQFVNTGHVKTGATKFPIFTGYNVLSVPRAVGTKFTLASSGLYTGNTTTGVAGATSFAAADQITLYKNGSPAGYFYYDEGPSSPSNGWTDPSLVSDSSLVELTEGTGILLNRKGAPYNWTIPAETISN